MTPLGTGARLSSSKAKGEQNAEAGVSCRNCDCCFGGVLARAGTSYRAGGEFGDCGGAGDSGFADGNGGEVWVVSECDAGGLESGSARDADCDTLCGYRATAFCGADGRGAAAAHVFCGCGRQWEISPEWRRLHRVCERRGWRRVVSALSL